MENLNTLKFIQLAQKHAQLIHETSILLFVLYWYGCYRLGHLFDCKLSPLNVQDRYTWDLSNTTTQVFIVSPHQVTSMLRYTIYYTVIGICALVTTGKSPHSRVLCYSKGQTILVAQLFQLSYHTVRDARNHLSQQTVHHRLEHVKLVLNGEVDKVRIHNHLVRRPQILVSGEEQRS